MTGYDEERIAASLRLLPPAPQGWVQAAQELPLARAAIESIVARAEADAAFRARLVADLEAAVEEAGYEATPSVLASIRLRLDAG
jgi:type VI protein secretion system component VasF